MIFLTVGTQFPFDRLVKAVDDVCEQGLFNEEIFAQIGDSSYQPRNFKYVKFLEKIHFDCRFKDASAIISHVGIGAVTMAIKYSKPLLVLPRSARHGEIVNDHQLYTAKKFEQLGCILAAYETEDLLEKIKQLSSFVPKKRENGSRLVTARIADFLKEIHISKEQL